MGKDGSFESVRNRLEAIKSSPGAGDCTTCECYHLLLFYIVEELASMKNPEGKALYKSILKEFKNRRNLKLHGCKGCVPCNPAEWSAEFAKKKKAK
ncbi:MAG: hypothetical protein QXH42_10060 [Thermoplasmata archaeon]